MSGSVQFVSLARHTLNHSLNQLKDTDLDGRLRAFETYQGSVIGHFLEVWKHKLLYQGLRHWLDIDYKYKIQLLDERAANILRDPHAVPPPPPPTSSKQQDDLPKHQNAQEEADETDETNETNETDETDETLHQQKTDVPLFTHTKRTPEQIQDVIAWLKVRYADTLSLVSLDDKGLLHLGTTVGHILTKKPGERIVHDSDPVNTLGCWMVLSGTVVVSIDSKQPSSTISMGPGEKCTSKVLGLHSVHFEAASNDELFHCHAGFTAKAGDEVAKVLFISQTCLIGSIGVTLMQRKNRSDRIKTLKKFVRLLVGKRYDDQQDLTLERLASQASVEQLSRKSIVKPRSSYLGLAEEGTFTVYTTCKSDKPGQRTQVAVITEIGSIVHCSAEEANGNRRGKKQYTLFQHQVVVSSSQAVVVWVPLACLDNNGSSSSASVLRTALSQIVETQAIQRVDRSNNAATTLNNVSRTEKDRRRKQAANILTEANSKAEDLKQHISEFMDWKNKADADMNFGDLDLTPARPSLCVVSPTKTRWTWNHNDRDLAGGGGGDSGGGKNRIGKSSPSKYAVSRNTYQ
jgi:hypothetical protein